jgi:hypothetical protein
MPIDTTSSFDGVAVGDRHLARGRTPDLVPDRERVRAARHPRNRVAAVVVGDGEERMAEDEDVRAHVRVDVARDGHDAGPIEPHRARAAGTIPAEVERPGWRERKRVVEGRIAVREIDGRADGDRENARDELLAPLIDLRAAGTQIFEGLERRRVEVDNGPPAIDGVGACGREIGDGRARGRDGRLRDHHLAANAAGTRRGRGAGGHGHPGQDERGERADHGRRCQNQ